MDAIISNIAKSNIHTKGMLIALLGSFLMSLDPVFIRVSGVSGFDTSFLYGLFSCLSMAAFVEWKEDKGLVGTIKSCGWPAVLSGLLMLGSAASLILSIKYTSVANTFIILSSSPAISAVLSWFILREVTQRATVYAIISIMIGIAVVVSGSLTSTNLLGDGLALCAAIFSSLNNILLRKHQHVNRMISVGFGGFFLALVMFFLATPSEYDMNTWIIMGIMGLATAPFSRVLLQISTRYITATEVSIVGMMVTVLAPIWAFLFFGEIPLLNSLIGGTIILTSVLLYTYSKSRA